MAGNNEAPKISPNLRMSPSTSRAADRFPFPYQPVKIVQRRRPVIFSTSIGRRPDAQRPCSRPSPTVPTKLKSLPRKMSRGREAARQCRSCSGPTGTATPLEQRNIIPALCSLETLVRRERGRRSNQRQSTTRRSQVLEPACHFQLRRAGTGRCSPLLPQLGQQKE